MAIIIATIKNCCEPMVVKCILFAMCVELLLLGAYVVQHDICYACNVIVVRHLIQHEVVATELCT